MILVESIIGNVNEAPWADRLGGARLDVLSLDQWQAQKNRFRLKTSEGTEVAVALDRNSHLHDGDVLAWDEASRTAVVARIQLQDVLVIHLDGLVSQPAATLARTCFELGHALGNQHWPAVVKGTTVYVPLTVDRKVMASVMKTHAFEGIHFEFAPGSEIIPYLAPHESRRLFGGADSTPHVHTPIYVRDEAPDGGDPSGLKSHSHSQTHTHTHDHGDHHH
ncbi:MAG: urease accessory protein UreE [Paludisphaera borealis]|uniref:urease accessory protein UreE n=1 Tax=Paludisphaera borealis TaxID=1387353 RepID=UPI0028403C45|nr:urease accessory protein UreE [Paludisphaera borealis]MDR3621861.1 urease accessory protein UreE [Paludisphaera borealis]